MAAYSVKLSINASNEAQAKKVATQLQNLAKKLDGQKLEKMLDWVANNPTMVNMALTRF